MLRRVIAGLVLVGMAIGIWLLWPRSEDPTTSLTTAPMASEPSTTGTSSAATTAIDDASTSTTVTDDHLVETVDEAEAILRELWFGWFEGIYNQDEDRIREVVATEEFLSNALTAFGQLEILKAPEPQDLVFSKVEILRSDGDCLVIWSSSDLAPILGQDATREGVDVLRRVENEWKMATAWAFRGDLWEADCDALLRPLS